MSESLVGFKVAATRQEAGTSRGAPEAGRTVPAANSRADVIVTFLIAKAVRSSHVLAAAARAKKTTATRKCARALDAGFMRKLLPGPNMETARNKANRDASAVKRFYTNRSALEGLLLSCW